MRFLLSCALLACIGLAQATSVEHLSLDELVRKADHVVLATVVEVDMVDRRGRQVTDPEARTGPGRGNTIRLHLAVRDVLYSRELDVPATLVVPLWSAWHYTLGSITESAQGTQGIFLLEGERFLPAYPADFQRALEEREEILRILRNQRSVRTGPGALPVERDYSSPT